MIGLSKIPISHVHALRAVQVTLCRRRQISFDTEPMLASGASPVPGARETLPESDGMRRVSALAENAKPSAALDKVNSASINNIDKSIRYMYDTILGCVLPFWYGGFCVARLGFSEMLLHLQND